MKNHTPQVPCPACKGDGYTLISCLYPEMKPPEHKTCHGGSGTGERGDLREPETCHGSGSVTPEQALAWKRWAGILPPAIF